MGETTQHTKQKAQHTKQGYIMKQYNIKSKIHKANNYETGGLYINPHTNYLATNQ